ncbi:hypothetical protein, conserved [Leishmania tarentolae]|uniref:Uncharacterized protein n=1 Tax=Leishmania tarentolae TaxID=5689 RepID=A0A640KIS3_LEITA|nr:hypothetical protein, conserved [Leishmania tarentolae]
MSTEEGRPTEEAAVVDEDCTSTSSKTSPKKSSGKTLLPSRPTPAERRGLIMVATVALLQETRFNVFCGILVGAASAAFIYNRLSHLRKRS